MNFKNTSIVLFFLVFFVSQITLANGGENILTSSKNEISNKLLLQYNFNDSKVLDVLNVNQMLEEGDEELSTKSPWLAFFLSMLLPTTGQIYNGDYTEALIQGGLILGGLGLVAGTTCVECGDTGSLQTAIFLTGLGMASAGYLWSIIDAPISANRHNSRIKRQKGLTLISSEDGEYILILNSIPQRNVYELTFSLNF